MQGSQVCWQLFLGWALLLGQPVFGDSDASEQPSLEDPEKPVLEVPEKTGPKEPEEAVTEAEEEPVPEDEEPEPEENVAEEKKEPEEEESPTSAESIEERLEEILERKLTSHERDMFSIPSDDELETRAAEERIWLQINRDDPHSRRLHFLKNMVLQHHNQKSGSIYRSYNGNIKLKKAIGTMMYIRLLLVKTNCTKEEGKELISNLYESVLGYRDDITDDNTPRTRRICVVPPESEQEILECTFTIFHNARSSYPKEVVTGHQCETFKQPEKDY